MQIKNTFRETKICFNSLCDMYSNWSQTDRDDVRRRHLRTTRQRFRQNPMVHVSCKGTDPHQDNDAVERSNVLRTVMDERQLQVTLS